MSEKAYILNIYNTMTGEFELVQVTNADEFSDRR